jgi:hypothetical protein
LRKTTQGLSDPYLEMNDSFPGNGVVSKGFQKVFRVYIANLRGFDLI